MNRPLSSDVLVVGAGPAGASAAWRLARSGLHVRLLDAASFPRSKPCGEAISPGATPLLRELGIDARLRATGVGRLRGWRIRASNGAWFQGRFVDREVSSPAWGWALLRSELDALLLEAAVEAGVEFHPGHRVYRLTRSGRRVTGAIARDGRGEERAFESRALVGADGLRSRVARLLGRVRRGRRRRLALVGRVGGGPVMEVRPGSPEAWRAPELEGGEKPQPGKRVSAEPGAWEGPEPGFGELRLARGGLVGLAPLGRGRWNVTVVVPAADARTIRGDVEGFYRQRLAAFGAPRWLDRTRMLGEIEVTGPFELYPSRLTAPGAVLTGDAVGYFDPFTGQGVYRALVTARLAADAVADALERPEREDATWRCYVGAVRRFLGPGRRVQRLIDAAVFRPRLMNRIAPVLATRPGLADLLVDVTGDRLPPGSLVSPRRLSRALARTGAGRRLAPGRSRAALSEFGERSRSMKKR